MNIQELRDQLESVREEMRGKNRNNPKESAEYAALKEREGELIAQIQEVEQKEREQVIEQKVHSEIRFAIPGVDFTQLPEKAITIIELIVKAERKKLLNEHAVELEQLEREHAHYKQDTDGVIIALEEKYEEAKKEIQEREAERLRLVEERNEAKRNRDNAAALVQEANAEIARLKSLVDDYQKVQAFGEREAQNIIDVTPDDAEEINAAIKAYVSSEDWGSSIRVDKPDGTFELVKRAEFEAEWAPITPPSLGGSEPAGTFQDDTPIDVIDDRVSDSEEVTAPSFREEETENAAPTVVGDETLSEGDGESFEEEVKRRLKALETQVFGSAQEVA